MFEELKIVADGGRRRRYAKTREFTAYLMGSVEADSMWDKGSSGKGRRPAWISFVATAGMARPFLTNFRGGHRVQCGSSSSVDDCFEIPKSSPHRWVTQETQDGAIITTAYLSELFHVEPVIPPERVTFISMPPRWWVDREAEKLSELFGTDARDVAKAGLFAAYLDRRTALPIVSDLRFQLALYRSALASAIVVKKAEDRWSRQGLQSEGMEVCGLEEPVAVDATHDAVAALLRAEVRTFFDEVVRKESAESGREAGHVLAAARRVPVQLSLDFEMDVSAA